MGIRLPMRLQVWLTVAISADRFYCVRFATSASRVCTPKRACLVALELLPLSLVLNLPRFFVYSSRLHVNNCSGREHFHHDELQVLPNWLKSVYVDVLDTLVYYALPLLLLVFLNAALIQSLRAASRRRYQMGLQNGTGSRGGPPNQTHQQNQHQHSKRDSTITLTLIVVVSVFIVLETPLVLLNLVDFACKLINSLYMTNVNLSPKVCSISANNETVMICSVVFTLLTLLNSSIDLFLYALVNSNFRKDLLALLSYKCLERINGPASRGPLRR